MVVITVLKVIPFCLLWYSTLAYVSNPKFIPVEDYCMVFATSIM
jgi:hypothetical protein